MKEENAGNRSHRPSEIGPAEEAFPGSALYWEERYQAGGNSGGGSYNKFAEFKAEVLNRFVAEKKITSVIEYGCGDGNQLKLAIYPSYLGFDVSAEAIRRCRAMFDGDMRKQFKLVGEYTNEKAELTLSLDVIYHLVEDSVFTTYMQRLLDSAERFVCIYSSDTDLQYPNQPPHVKHRRFSSWIANERPGWKLLQHIPNRYPFSKYGEAGSFADFVFYQKVSEPESPEFLQSR